MRRGQDGGAWVIVISMLLVIVGAVTLVIGVFFAGDNLQLVYVSIIACLLAGLFLVAGIIRGRSGRRAATAGAGEAGAPAPAPTSTWGPSGTGAVQGWGAAASQETQVNQAAAPTVGATPTGQEDTHAPGPDESWAPAGDPLGDTGEGDVRVLEPDEESAEIEPEGEVSQDEAISAQAPPEPQVAPPKSVAKKTARKGATKKAAKSGGTKAGKKTTKKATTAKKSTGEKTAGKKAAGKKTAGKKTAGKKTAGKKTAGKKAAGKKAASSGKERIDTELADVSGVGDAKRQALAEHFGSYERLRDASVEEITEVRGISPTLAQRVYDGLRS